MTIKKPALTKDVKTAVLSIALFVAFTILALWIPGSSERDHISTVFGATTFIFGILSAFYISTSFSRYNDIVSALQNENSTLLYIYYTAKVFDKKRLTKLRDLIDSYLIAELDYFLKDFHESENKFAELYDFINSIKPKNKAEESARDNMLNEINESLKSRKQVESLVTASMSPLEWITLISLLAIVLVSMFLLNTNTLFLYLRSQV